MNLNPTLARLTGILYLGLFVFGMFGPLVLEATLVPGDAQATAANLAGSPLFKASLGAWFLIVILDIVVSITLYQLFRQTRPTGAIVVGVTRLVYTAMLAANLTHLADALAATDDATVLAALESFSRGFAVALTIFGAHLAALGLTGFGAMPKWLAAALTAAGAAYILDGGAKVMGASNLAGASDLFMGLAVLGELGLMLWLLWADRPRRHSQARATTLDACEVVQ